MRVLARAAPMTLLFALAAAGAVRAQPLADGELSRLAAIRLGLSRNLTLLTKRLEQRRLEMLSRAALGAYGPGLFASGVYHALEPDAVSPEQRYLEYAVGAGWKSLLGTQVSAQLQMDQALPSPGEPLHGAALSVSVTQPLLKDAWRSGASLPLTEARLLAQVQRELYRAELNRLLVELESAYWDLAVAQADVAIKTRSLERARSQRADTAENIRRGIIADAEIYLVDENVVIFEQEHLLAQERLVLSRRNLAQLLALPTESPLAAKDALERSGRSLPDRRAALELALGGHPVLKSQDFLVQLASARVDYWRNQTLPALGLTAGLGLRSHDQQYQSAWSRLWSQPVADARVGLTFGLTLDRFAARAALESARSALSQQQNELARQQDVVRFELENAYTDLSTNEQLLSLAQRQVELAEKKLKAQSDKYQSGLSTLADVVRFQRDLDNASIAARRVARTTRVGHARLLASQGGLLEALQAEGL